MTTIKHIDAEEGSEMQSEFMDSLHAIKNVINPTLIDISDSRTNYIMSK